MDTENFTELLTKFNELMTDSPSDPVFDGGELYETRKEWVALREAYHWQVGGAPMYIFLRRNDIQRIHNNPTIDLIKSLYNVSDKYRMQKIRQSFETKKYMNISLTDVEQLLTGNAYFAFQGDKYITAISGSNLSQMLSRRINLDPNVIVLRNLVNKVNKLSPKEQDQLLADIAKIMYIDSLKDTPVHKSVKVESPVAKFGKAPTAPLRQPVRTGGYDELVAGSILQSPVQLEQPVEDLSVIGALNALNKQFSKKDKDKLFDIYIHIDAIDLVHANVVWITDWK